MMPEQIILGTSKDRALLLPVNRFQRSAVFSTPVFHLAEHKTAAIPHDDINLSHTAPVIIFQNLTALLLQIIPGSLLITRSQFPSAGVLFRISTYISVHGFIFPYDTFPPASAIILLQNAR